MLNRPDLYEFVRIGELAETTTQLLALNLQHNTTLGKKLAGGKRLAGQQDVGKVEMMVLQQAKRYLTQVKEGFTLSTQTTQVLSHVELRYLLDTILFDWELFDPGEESGSELMPIGENSCSQQERDSPLSLSPLTPTHESIAFGMAAIALGALPKLSAEQITFPFSYSHPPTYADIPSPKSAGELLWRIDEVEKTLWQVMSGDLQALLNHHYGQLRRTYGFFEASAYLARQESERFGVKKPQINLSFF